MKNVLLAALRGIAQVMLQNNALTGILFLLGIFYNSWQLGVAAIIGTLTSTLTAYLLKYPKNEIESGLFGFNGTLVGIAVCFYFGFSGISIFTAVIGALLSAPIMYVARKRIPVFTLPFLLITWFAVFLIPFTNLASFEVSAPKQSEIFDLFSATTQGIGQVMFQGNRITGLLFLSGIAVNSRIAGVYSLYGAVLGTLTAYLFLPVPITSLNIGLFGYNAVLCAIALGDKRWTSFLITTLAIVLSSVLNFSMDFIGMIPLTAPFVLSTWCLLWIKKP